MVFYFAGKDTKATDKIEGVTGSHAFNYSLAGEGAEYFNASLRDLTPTRIAPVWPPGEIREARKRKSF